MEAEAADRKEMMFIPTRLSGEAVQQMPCMPYVLKKQVYTLCNFEQSLQGCTLHSDPKTITQNLKMLPAINLTWHNG